MTDAAIRVDSLSKQYQIGAARRRTDSLRDWLVMQVRRKHDARDESIWALSDVSFQVDQGEVVGVVGRNGAGKSTLLKILSRITEPTKGRVVLNGRVGSLLEVGTGFHPELTGRENIYLSGAILGMTGREIDRKFDEIVSFSELHKFIDTPVKRYSSGMNVRLGFAVAAHLEPEILLVDEVLAVGDAAFQKKCLGKIDDAAHTGRTVLFVSHNMAMVNKICDRALWIDGGQVRADGDTVEIVRHYVESGRVEQEVAIAQGVNHEALARQTSKAIIIRGIELLSMDGHPLNGAPVEDALRVRIHYSAKRPIMTPGFDVKFRSHDGVELCRVSNMPISGFHIDRIEGDGTIEVAFDKLPFTGGRYYICLGVARASVQWLLYMEDVAWFDVALRDVYDSGLALDASWGYLFVSHSWKHQQGRVLWPANPT